MKKSVYMLAAAIIVCSLMTACGSSAQEMTVEKGVEKAEGKEEANMASTTEPEEIEEFTGIPQEEITEEGLKEVDSAYYSPTALIAEPENSGDAGKSAFDAAYKLDLGDYYVCYMIDEDEHRVARFTTADDFCKVGTYTGDLDEGVDVEFSRDDHDLLKRKEKGDDAVLLMTGSFDPEYEYAEEYQKISVEEAQEALSGMAAEIDFSKEAEE